VAYDLKYRITMIDSIETNVPLCPLNMVGIATDIHRHQPEQVSGTHPAAKGVRVHGSCRVVSSPSRAECIFPTLEVEFTDAEKFIALMHRPRHFPCGLDDSNTDFPIKYGLPDKFFYCPHDKIPQA
jgi:hypothetical protein